jgi:hypothetical protein
MKQEQIVIVDWSRSATQVGVFAETARGWQLQSEMTMAARLVVMNQLGGEPCVLAGDQAANATADGETLIFEQPAVDLPRLEDPELQTLLLAGFWRGLGENLNARELLRADCPAAGYLVTPYRFSQALLQKFRACCAAERSLKFCGHVHEAAALAVGFLRSEIFEDAMPAAGPVTLCLVVAASEQKIDVVCLDYTRAAGALHRIVIRDFFQTTCAQLSERLHECDWLGLFSRMFILQEPSLKEDIQAALNAPLQAIAAGCSCDRHQWAGASQLKLRGAAHIGLCAGGQAPDEQEYDVTHACHIGVQIDQQHFQPVIHKDEWARLTEFPYLAAQAFRLSGRPGNALRLNFCSGYSTSVAEAASLGHAMLWHEDLAQLEGAALTAAVRLDAPGDGEFLLGLMPENRALRRQEFTLPGLVG